MENKTTTELIDLLTKAQKKEPYDGDKVDELLGELRNREPFYSIMHPDFDESLPALNKRIDELESDIRALKRHKHDVRTGDVMIRI